MQYSYIHNLYIVNALDAKFFSLIIFSGKTDFTTEHFSTKLLSSSLWESRTLNVFLDMLLILVRTLKMVYSSYMKPFRTNIHREELGTNPPFFQHHPFSLLKSMRLTLAFDKSSTLICTLNQFWNERWSFLFLPHSHFTPTFVKKMLDSPKTAEKSVQTS